MSERIKYTTASFIERANHIHDGKYDYSKTIYEKYNGYVTIICPIHGEFRQRADHHLEGYGCALCSQKQRKTKEQFIEDAKKIHGEKYDYSYVIYKNANTKVKILCKTCGRFFSQKPTTHLSGCGCPTCAAQKRRMINASTKEEFIKKAEKKHGGFYDYSKVEYVNNETKVLIVCPIHGEFKQTPHHHLIGEKCPHCAMEDRAKKNTMSVWQFLSKARIVHGNKYDYSQVRYSKSSEHVTIICPKHGPFIQTPCHHLNGNGCPKCQRSQTEEMVSVALLNEGIRFVEQKRFPWLKKKRGMSLDFYLPDYNLAIECQGKQHFEPTDFGSNGAHSAIKTYLEVCENDKLKKQLCEENGIKMVYFSNVKNFDNFLGIPLVKSAKDLLDLLKKLNKAERG